MLLQDKRIAIVGGGPGGLTLARLLQQNGAAVTVYERDRDCHARGQGGTLDLHHDAALAALREARLLAKFKACYRPGADLLRLTDKQAVMVYDQHAAAPTDTFGDAAFRPEIDRGPLRDLLLDSLQPGTVVWNSRLAALTPQGRGWQLAFEDGRVAPADVVIGADGATPAFARWCPPAGRFMPASRWWRAPCTRRRSTRHGCTRWQWAEKFLRWAIAKPLLSALKATAACRFTRAAKRKRTGPTPAASTLPTRRK